MFSLGSDISQFHKYFHEFLDLQHLGEKFICRSSFNLEKIQHHFANLMPKFNKQTEARRSISPISVQPLPTSAAISS